MMMLLGHISTLLDQATDCPDRPRSSSSLPRRLQLDRMNLEISRRVTSTRSEAEEPQTVQTVPRSSSSLPRRLQLDRMNLDISRRVTSTRSEAEEFLD
ncbi:hypothetical protein DY000_02043027 [Brassica cretica]|uniref:AC4 n=1 Tax=Brassica cretica TaxID=69181 RepID=A0ABQ7BMR3_BRACR|nr:hypothetical protein DY000_02043027 [Brassica cretica]